MDQDRAAERTLRLVGGGSAPGEAPWVPVARTAGCWEADVVPFPGRFRDQPGVVSSLVVVGAAGFILEGDVVVRPMDAAGRARAVVEAVLKAARRVGVLPPTLHVRDGRLAEALALELEPRGIDVAAAEMPDLDEAIRSSLTHLAGSEVAAHATAVETWHETEATPGEVAEFHAVAAAFFRAEPWTMLYDHTPLVFAFPDGTMFMGVVMGGAAMEYGLALYSNPEDVADLYGSDDDEDAEDLLRRMKGWTLTASFERRSRLPRAMQREVAAAGWEVAGANAYPLLYGLRVPGFRLAAEHVRTMTAAMAGTVLLVSGDEAPAPVHEVVERTGLQIGAPCGDDDSPWQPLEQAHAIGPVGPNADPQAALRHLWGSDLSLYEAFRAVELERVRRFETWLAGQGLSKAAQRRHLRNARVWSEYLAGMAVTAPAATEYDLRSYLYDWFPRKESVPRDVERALPESLRVFFRWLEVEEGIGYPWSGPVLDEFPDVVRERGESPEGMFWDDDVRDWRSALWEDLDARVMLHNRELPGTEEGWPVMMDAEVAQLQAELQRRWLIWYDEAVHGGVAEPDALYDALVLRQREWENTPHPQVGGRTPRQVIAEYVRKQASAPRHPLADAGRKTKL